MSPSSFYFQLHCFFKWNIQYTYRNIIQLYYIWWYSIFLWCIIDILIVYMPVLHTYPRFKLWSCQQKQKLFANKSGSCLGDGIVFIAAWCLKQLGWSYISEQGSKPWLVPYFRCFPKIVRIPKWMVYDGKSLLKWMISGENTTIFGNIHISGTMRPLQIVPTVEAKDLLVNPKVTND